MKLTPRKRKIDGKIYRDWVVDLGLVDGKRKRRAFTDKEVAEKFIEDQLDHRDRHKTAALGLAPEVSLRYAAAEQRLAAVGASIEQAVDFYLAQLRPVKERLSLGEAFDRCVLEKELAGLSSAYISTFSCSVGSFVDGRRGLPIEEVSREMLQKWITGNKWAPKTQRGYLGDMRAFFAWAIQEQLLARSPLEPDSRGPGRPRPAITLGKIVQKEPEIFSPEQIQRLFAMACTRHEIAEDPNLTKDRRRPLPVYRRLLGYLALATFAGIRPLELTRLEANAIDLESGLVGLDGKVTKTNDRRVVELSPNCVAWLKVWRAEFPNYKHPAPPSWDRLLKALRKALKIPWPHDVLRHSFASYYHATHADKGLLQKQMGHSQSEDTLERHYRAVRTPDGRPLSKALAAKFWDIWPPGHEPKKEEKPTTAAPADPERPSAPATPTTPECDPKKSSEP